jgi:hypothetical protein
MRRSNKIRISTRPASPGTPRTLRAPEECQNLSSAANPSFDHPSPSTASVHATTCSEAYYTNTGNENGGQKAHTAPPASSGAEIAVSEKRRFNALVVAFWRKSDSRGRGATTFLRFVGSSSERVSPSCRGWTTFRGFDVSGRGLPGDIVDYPCPALERSGWAQLAVAVGA